MAAGGTGVFGAILRQRCPRCLEGHTFQKGITMYQCCTICGLKFEREQGYFVGALYIAYAMAVPIVSMLAWAVWLVSRWPFGRVLTAGALLLVPFAPFIFRYSRVLWLHMDYHVEPW